MTNLVSQARPTSVKTWLIPLNQNQTQNQAQIIRKSILGVPQGRVGNLVQCDCSVGCVDSHKTMDTFYAFRYFLRHIPFLQKDTLS